MISTHGIHLINTIAEELHLRHHRRLAVRAYEWLSIELSSLKRLLERARGQRLKFQKPEILVNAALPAQYAVSNFLYQIDNPRQSCERIRRHNVRKGSWLPRKHLGIHIAIELTDR